jgi:hypothetical protein
MSALARTALRLAGVEALNADPVIAALCDGRVYDSRIAELNETDAVPVIVVLTEAMEGEAYGDNNGGPPFNDHCELILDIAYRAIVLPEGKDDAEPEIGVASTDRELEATLDLLEQRAVEALTVGDSDQSRLVRQVTRRISAQKSERFADDNTGVKLAIRQVTLTAELKGEDQRDARVLADPVIGAAQPGAGNAGNGTLSFASPAYDKWLLKGTYTVIFTGATAFAVTDPNGAAVGDGIVDSGFQRQLYFGIAPGSTPFAAGDVFTIAVTQGPFAALPEPLRSVCNAMPQGSSGAAICTLLAAAYGTPAAIEFFTGANLTFAPTLRLDRDQAPIEPGQPGSSPSLGLDDTIPSSQAR